MIHNHEVPGSIPGPATQRKALTNLRKCFSLFQEASNKPKSFTHDLLYGNLWAILWHSCSPLPLRRICFIRRNRVSGSVTRNNFKGSETRAFRPLAVREKQGDKGNLAKSHVKSQREMLRFTQHDTRRLGVNRYIISKNKVNVVFSLAFRTCLQRGTVRSL